MVYGVVIEELRLKFELAAVVLIQETDRNGLEVSLMNGTSFFWPGMTIEKFNSMERQMAAHVQQQQSGIIKPFRS